MTIDEFTSTFLPNISTKAVGVRAKKLGVKPATYKYTAEHKNKISKTLNKLNESDISRIKELRDSHSIQELASMFNVDTLTIQRYNSKNNIKLSDDGIRRWRDASRKGSIGKSPWNKGKKLPSEMLENMAIGRSKMSNRLSGIQAAFYKVLEDNNIKHYKEDHELCRVGPWTFDCRIADYGKEFLVEVQGQYIHSLPKNISKDRAKLTYIEKYYPDLGVKYIYEHEFGALNRVKQVVRSWLGLDKIDQIDFDFKDIVVEQVTDEEAQLFLSAFHYLGHLAGRIKIGAKLHGKLIGVSIWGAPTRTETAIRLNATARTCLELRRFVIHDAYHKKNFASWFLARQRKLLPPNIEVLVSFADQGFGHHGSIYHADNWQMDGETQQSYFYIDEEGYVVLKKTLYNLANKMHMTERLYAETFGFSKVQTQSKFRFIKRLK